MIKLSKEQKIFIAYIYFTYKQKWTILNSYRVVIILAYTSKI